VSPRRPSSEGVFLVNACVGVFSECVCVCVCCEGRWMFFGSCPEGVYSMSWCEF
jgi:hypothetical protein